MRKPKLTVDTLLAALAVLGPATGCSKAERAAPEAQPVVSPQAPAAATAGAAPSSMTTTIDPAAAPPSPPSPPKVVEVDAGRELKKAGPKAGAQAACGASGCSPDMKKGH